MESGGGVVQNARSGSVEHLGAVGLVEIVMFSVVD